MTASRWQRSGASLLGLVLGVSWTIAFMFALPCEAAVSRDMPVEAEKMCSPQWFPTGVVHYGSCVNDLIGPQTTQKVEFVSSLSESLRLLPGTVKANMSPATNCTSPGVYQHLVRLEYRGKRLVDFLAHKTTAFLLIGDKIVLLDYTCGTPNCWVRVIDLRGIEICALRVGLDVSNRMPNSLYTNVVEAALVNNTLILHGVELEGEYYAAIDLDVIQTRPGRAAP